MAPLVFFAIVAGLEGSRGVKLIAAFGRARKALDEKLSDEMIEKYANLKLNDTVDKALQIR